MTSLRFASTCLLALAASLSLAAPASPQTVRSAAGSFATAQAARDQFRLDLGGGNTAGAGGSFGGLRREINWDGAGDAVSLPNLMPADQFQARGVVFTTPGTGFAMSAKVGNPTGTAVRFGNFDPAHAGRFAAFSAERLFASLGSPVYDVVFFVPGTNQPAVVTGFGAAFTDVDLAGASWMEYFDVDGVSLGRFDVPWAAGDGTFSFLGVSFAGAPKIGRVRIAAGNHALDLGGEPGGKDAVAVDDLLYGEPLAAEGAGCIETPTAICLANSRFRVEATFSAVQAGTGKAKAFALTPDSGTLSFFAEANREVLIKVLDACGLNDRFWVYGAAATDVAYAISVTDTATGEVVVYEKEQGPPAPAITDADAFATCGAD